MFKLKIYFLVLLLAIMVAPQVSLAYLTTDQKAVQLNSDTLLYTVTYKFGLPDSSLIMPLVATRGLKFGDASRSLGYTLLNNGKRIAKATTYGIVLSNVPVVNNEYIVPPGKLATFTLVVAVKLGTEINLASEEGTNLSLQVTSLPFTIVDSDGNKVLGKLNPSELQYYMTNEVAVKENSGQDL